MLLIIISIFIEMGGGIFYILQMGFSRGKQPSAPNGNKIRAFLTGIKYPFVANNGATDNKTRGKSVIPGVAAQPEHFTIEFRQPLLLANSGKTDFPLYYYLHITRMDGGKSFALQMKIFGSSVPPQRVGKPEP